MPSPVSNEDRQTAVSMAKNHSVEDIAKAINRNPTTVKRILARAEKNGGNADFLPTGGDRKSLTNESVIVNYTKKLVAKSIHLSSKSISKIWKRKFGVERSDSAVRNILIKYNVPLSELKAAKTGKSDKEKSSQIKVPSPKEKFKVFPDFLAPEEVAALTAMSKKKGVSGQIKVRCNAVLALNRGETVRSVANCFGVTRKTVRKWLRIYLNGGLKQLAHLGYAGMQNRSKTSWWQEYLIKEYIRENPTTNLRALGAWIKQMFGINYSKSGMHRLIHRLGFRYRKSKLLPRFPPIAIQKAWLADFALMMEESPDGTVVLYLDGFHPRLQGKTAGCWSEQGKIPVLEQATARQGLNILGALNADTGKFTYLTGERLNKHAVIKLLEKIRKAYADAPKVVIVLDNVSYHRAKEVTEWRQNQPRVGPHIQFHFLPAYCPHFNLIERLWKKFHEEVTHNKVQENLEMFIEDSLEFLDGVEKNWKKYKSYVNVKINPIDPEDDKFLHVNRSSKESDETVSKQMASKTRSNPKSYASHSLGKPPP